MGKSLKTMLPRRNFLSTLILASLGSPRLQAVAPSVNPLNLSSSVTDVVKRRESLVDDVARFRVGGSLLIDEAMGQFLQVLSENAANPLPRLQALSWTLSQYVSEPARASYAKNVRNQHVEGSVTSFGVGNYKCNKLVADAYAVGAGVGLSIGNDWTSPGQGTGWPALRDGESLWPPKANELAKPEWNSRSLTNARPLRQAGEPKAQPELGDLIAFPSEGDFGHVCLYVGKNLIISAKETGIEIGPIAPEQAEHGGIVRIRKFTGTGK